MPIKCTRLADIRRSVERRTGLYTKKGCVEVATEIGKKLIDIKKSGKQITKEDYVQVIEQCAPHIKKPNIATSVEELSQLLDKNGVDAVSKAKAICMYANKQNVQGWLEEGIKGFCIRSSTGECTKFSPETIAHEFEHFTEYYANLSTVLKRFLLYINPLNISKRIKYKKWLKFNLKRVDYDDFIQNVINKYSESIKEPGVQQTLFRYCGVARQELPGIKKTFVEGYKSTSEEVTRLFQSPLYNGLSSNKDINQYIRTIIRHYAHPDILPPRSIKDLKMVFETEAKAYEVSDNIARYVMDRDDLSIFKIRSEIFKRASKIERRELWRSRFAIFRRLKKHKYIPNLPPSAVNG